MLLVLIAFLQLIARVFDLFMHMITHITLQSKTQTKKWIDTRLSSRFVWLTLWDILTPYRMLNTHSRRQNNINVRRQRRSIGTNSVQNTTRQNYIGCVINAAFVQYIPGGFPRLCRTFRGVFPTTFHDPVRCIEVLAFLNTVNATFAANCYGTPNKLLLSFCI